MKRFLLSLSLILAITLMAEAQPYRHPQPCSSVRYYAPCPKAETPYYYDNIGEVRLHIAGELGIVDPVAFFWHRIPRHYSIGTMAEVQVSRRLSLGIGAEFYGTRVYDQAYSAYFNSVPVYGNIRLSSPGYGTKFFVEARAGYAIPVNIIGIGSPTNYYEARGFFTGGGIGFSFYGNNISFGVNAIDIANYNGVVLMNGSPTRARVNADFYLKYSYAIPLN